MRMTSESGFTIAEVTVVIGVLGVLLILGMMNYTDILESNKITAARSDAQIGADTVYGYRMSTGAFREEECKDKLKKALPAYTEGAWGDACFQLVKDPGGQVSAVDFYKKLDGELTILHRYIIATDELESRALTDDGTRGEKLKQSGGVDGVCGLAEGWCVPG